MKIVLVLVLVLVLGCQGQSGRGGTGSGSSTSTSTSTSTTKKDATAASGSGSAGSDFVMDLPKSPPEDQDPVVDVGKAIADLGAIPAWQAVVDRAQYLARRGQHGVVFGTLAAMTAPGSGSGSGSGSETESPYLWLVDGTDGNGALAIRVRLGDKKAKPGDRVALGGAWALDDQREWYWKVDNLSPLPAAPASTSKDPPVPPGHAIASGDLRAGTRPISKADDGDLAYFQVVGAPPVADGDGWPVADELGNPVVALLDLPGERASYGAQDMRTADERWHLKRGVTYLVRIAVVHHHGSDKPATMRARTAPIKVM